MAAYKTEVIWQIRHPSLWLMHQQSCQVRCDLISSDSADIPHSSLVISNDVGRRA